jgi:hypothetical protein
MRGISGLAENRLASQEEQDDQVSIPGSDFVIILYITK